jgi:uncharacterized protein (DUF302 family)
MGDATVPEVVSLAKESATEAEFIQRVQERLVGERGFMLFHEIDHGGWLTRFGINRRVLQTAITMIRHGITAGLFAPVEILVTEKERGPGHDDHLRAPIVAYLY